MTSTAAQAHASSSDSLLDSFKHPIVIAVMACFVVMICFLALFICFIGKVCCFAYRKKVIEDADADGQTPKSGLVSSLEQSMELGNIGPQRTVGSKRKITHDSVPSSSMMSPQQPGPLTMQPSFSQPGSVCDLNITPQHTFRSSAQLRLASLALEQGHEDVDEKEESDCEELYDSAFRNRATNRGLTPQNSTPDTEEKEGEVNDVITQMASDVSDMFGDVPPQPNQFGQQTTMGS